MYQKSDVLPLPLPSRTTTIGRARWWSTSSLPQSILCLWTRSCPSSSRTTCRLSTLHRASQPRARRRRNNLRSLGLIIRLIGVMNTCSILMVQQWAISIVRMLSIHTLIGLSERTLLTSKMFRSSECRTFNLRSLTDALAKRGHLMPCFLANYSVSCSN